VAVHFRDAAAERSRVAVVRPRVAGVGFAAGMAPLAAAVGETHGKAAHSRDEAHSTHERKLVDDHSGGLADSPLAATKLTGGNP
jgi:hypothetical protein